MGQLVDGKWSTENVLVQHDDKGLYFKRDSVFRDRISSEARSEFAAEPGRYHLYCAVACPWAHRATLMRTLKKLEPLVTLSNTFQEPGGQGRSFGEQGHIVPGTGCYYVGYKCNLRRLDEYQNLSNYLRALYQTPGIAEVCDIAGMKRGVYSKAGPIGSNGIIPIGPTVDYSRPHDRDRLARRN